MFNDLIFFIDNLARLIRRIIDVTKIIHQSADQLHTRGSSIGARRDFF